MSQVWADIVVNTLVTGSIYALVGVGFVVLFRATGVVSFAQGSFMVLGALFYATLNRSHWPMLLAGLVAIAFTGLVGALVYWAIFRRLTGGPAFIVSIATVGLATVLEMFALIAWGSQPILVPQRLGYERTELIFNMSIGRAGLVTAVIAAVIFVLLISAIALTRTGRNMRAVADNPMMAAFTGISITRTSTIAWAIAGGVAAVAGIAFTLGTQPEPSGVAAIGLVALPAILLGGLDSISGALVGGLLLAGLQNLVIHYIGGDWQDVFSYGVLLIVLLVRPQGLFGSQQVARL